MMRSVSRALSVCWLSALILLVAACGKTPTPPPTPETTNENKETETAKPKPPPKLPDMSP